MSGRLQRAISIVRRHSGLVNLLRNATHLARGRRVSPGAWLLVDGNVRLGRGATVSRGCHITVPASGVLDLGERVWLNRDVEIDVLGRIVVGAHSTVQRGCALIGDVRIGRGCLLAPNVFISSGRHYFEIWPALPIRLQEARVAADPSLLASHSREVLIGDDCWLGVNSVVLPGVTIGRGAVVGANAVVARDVPPYDVVVGAPAHSVRKRLEFIPPRELDGMCEAQLPYFYSGFEYGTGRPPVADGDFVLALALGQADAVRLTLRNVGRSALQIVCGPVRAPIAPSEAREIDVPVDRARANDRLEVGLPTGGRIAIVRAAVLPAP